MNYDYCSGKIHTIKQGDTLYSISQKYGVSLDNLLKANPYVDVYNLTPGDSLCIPAKKPVLPTPGIKEEFYPLPTPDSLGDRYKTPSSLVTEQKETLASLLKKLNMSAEEFLNQVPKDSIYLLPGILYSVTKER